MARRNQTTPADALFELVALLPWWGGVALAVAAYLGLHRIAIEPVAIGGAPGQIGSTVAASLGHAAAAIGQYLLPIICLAAAAASFLARRKRAALVAGVASSGTAESLNDMSWPDFEKLVGEAYRLQGYRVAENGAARADGGVDLVLTRGREKFLVQCKQWRARQVGVEIVRELYGVMAATGATGGFVVTSGRFTVPAQEFAGGLNITLVDGPRLHAMIRQAQRSLEPAARSAAAASDLFGTNPGRQLPVSCPLCGARMVKRAAMQGGKAGRPFWGCSTYPTCRGTRVIPGAS